MYGILLVTHSILLTAYYSLVYEQVWMISVQICIEERKIVCWLSSTSVPFDLL
jgi:hypothetical protein